MLSRDGFDGEPSRREVPGTRKVIEALVALAKSDPDKARVMTCIGQLVLAGYAELQMRDNGEVEARFSSGEAYLLAETTILRLT